MQNIPACKEFKWLVSLKYLDKILEFNFTSSAQNCRLDITLFYME